MTVAATAPTKRKEYARGWPVVLASALGAGTGVNPLVFYSLGALVGPLTAAFGWSLTEVTAAPMFFTVASLFAGALVGGLADRYGARRVVIISQILLVLGFAAMSRIGPALWTLYAGYFALAILGAGTFTMTFARAITGWFVAGRGLALGLSLVGTGLIGAALPSYINWLVAHHGWASAYLGLALLPLVVGLPITILLFREPEEVATPGVVTAPAVGHGFGEAIGTLAYWQMTIGFFIAAVAIGAVMVHVIPMLGARGIDKATAAGLASLIGIAVTVGRLISGYLLDILPGRRVAFTMFALPAFAALLLLYAGDNLWLCGVAIAMVGLAAGAEHDIAGYFTARYFGRAHYGAIYGLLYTVYGLGSGLGPLAMGAGASHFGGYREGLLTAAACFAVAAVTLGTLRPPPPRVTESPAVR